ncbi:MAG TPA: LytR C-terminal domain-containing protein [Acidimicrobiales bacterium]|nr:LytR C-terminal domain-containing protein [Acidimicrobiales bacterium]
MSQRKGIPGRPPRQPAGGAGGPAGNAGARGALLLAVAVILGIVLLQQFDTPSVPSGQVSATSVPDDDETTSTTRPVGLTTVPQTTTTAGRARPKAEVKVLVANGAGVRGLGASTTNSLRERGYTDIATPTDATTSVERTAIQYVEGYEAEARELAGVLSLPATVITRLASPPVAAADIADAKLLVILGTDVSTAPTAPGATTTTRRP